MFLLCGLIIHLFFISFQKYSVSSLNHDHKILCNDPGPC